jgi:HPt (histidine-containing phosphotransfer) domain-containing protein
MNKAIVDYMKENLGLDDMDLIQELYDDYVNTIKERLPSANTALEAKDFMALAKIAHAMKGCALNIGHESFAVTAKELEYLGKGLGPEPPAMENCSALLSKLNTIFEDFLKAYVSPISNSSTSRFTKTHAVTYPSCPSRIAS